MLTILGGQGFVGRNLGASVRSRGIQCWAPKRDDPDIFSTPLGTVYYCIGLTADFRRRPFDTVDAHVGFLRQVLERSEFDQLIYLSSTRVYASSALAQEEQVLNVAPFEPDSLYNISKLMGECLALSSGRVCRVARLSNLLGFNMGSDNFVGALLAEAKKSKSVHFQTSPESDKDYLWIDDAVKALIAISEKGCQPIYNVASGQNVRNEAIAELFANKGVAVTFAKDAVTTKFPSIPIEKLGMDTGFRPDPIAPRFSELINKALD